MRRIITMMMIVLMAMTGRIAIAQTTPADTLLLIDTDMGENNNPSF